MLSISEDIAPPIPMGKGTPHTVTGGTIPQYLLSINRDVYDTRLFLHSLHCKISYFNKHCLEKVENDSDGSRVHYPGQNHVGYAHAFLSVFS